MNKFVETGFDLEVVPSKDDAVISRIKEKCDKKPITAPDGDKAFIGGLLGLDSKIIDKTTKAALQQLWLEENEEKARAEMFDKEWHKACFNSIDGEIVSLALNCFGQPIRGVYFRTDNQTITDGKIDGLYQAFRTELDILNNAVSLLDNIHDWATSNGGALLRFIGLNIYQFDLKYFCQRCMINGAKLPKFSLMLSQYDALRQLDLNTMWNCGERIKPGFPGFLSLESLCWALGVGNPKVDDEGEIHGADVCDIYYNGGDEGALRIAKYNLRDVMSYEGCFNKMRGILGD